MIIVIGEILMDVFDTYRRIGGAPFNFAFHLKQLGRPVRFITRIGDDAYGDEILRMLERQHFDLNDIQIDPLYPTGTVRVVLDPNGVPQFDIQTDVAYDHLDFATVAPIEWPSVRLVYFGTLAQRTHAAFLRIEHFLAQKSAQAKTFCDINLRLPHVHESAVLSSLHRADLLKLNSDELEVIQEQTRGPGSDEDLISWLLKRFDLEMLILTKGAEGSAIYTDHQVIRVPAPAAGPIVDTVGAGDAYAAVLAEGYLTGLPPKVIASVAADFAAYICSQPGAVPEDKSVYALLRERLKGKSDVQ